MHKLRNEQNGSAVILILFILALFIGGFFYTQIEKVVDEIENAVENDTSDTFLSVTGEPLADDSTYQFYLWMFAWGVPILILIGLSLWFVRNLRKDRYETL